jgi:hypothetical protein
VTRWRFRFWDLFLKKNNKFLAFALAFDWKSNAL